MPRKSIVSTLIESYSEEEVTFSQGPTEYLIIYKFPKNPSTRFYRALEGLNWYFPFDRIQNGVIKVESLNIAYLILSLIARYKGKCYLYYASEIGLSDVFNTFGFIDWKDTGLR